MSLVLHSSSIVLSSSTSFSKDEKGVKNIIYDIHRGGKQVTEDGDLVDSIKLEKSEQLSDVVSQGRFVGLLKHFTNKHSIVDDLLNKIISKKK